MLRVFLSPPNWFGFEGVDFWLLLAGLLFWIAGKPRLRWRIPWTDRTGFWAGALFVLPILSRLMLLRWHPVPVASGADDFGYLLLADTLRHFRLANPPHAHPEFFEQVFVLQRPTYSSMFNLGQGFVLALAPVPWVGVLLSSGAVCALVYWMLLGWTRREWALAGGLLSVMLFGPLCYWTNCYWGGALAACAGCLVFGSVARLRDVPSRRQVLVLGAGLALHLLVRPFETVLLALAVALFVPWRRVQLWWALLPLLIAVGLIGNQNRAVTGSWRLLPYQLYRYHYGIPATFTLQRNAVPHVPLNAEKQADYDVETATHGYAPETLWSYSKRLWSRIRFLRFFLFAPLYLAAGRGLLARPRVGLALCPFIVGSNFYPYFYPHYVAGAAGLLLLLAIMGLEKMGSAGPAIVLLCGLQFLGWMVAFAIGSPQEPTWNYVNGPDPEGRASVARQLAALPGKQLVFVHYGPDHRFSEWIHNAADIDGSAVIYVNDLDPAADRELRNSYPDRHVWLLSPDEEPPRLQRFPDDKKPFVDVP